MRFIFIILLLLTVSGVWYIREMSSHPVNVTEAPKTRTPFYGKGTFAPHGSFRIDYPDECIRTNTLLTCSYPEGSFVLQPEAGGHDAEPIKRDEKTLGGITWNRTLFYSQGKIGATYGVEKNGTYFVLEVTYTPFMQQIEIEAEKIIATFIPF